jgi:hypothetical protein
MAKQITDDMFISAARSLYHEEGTIEIDDKPEVSRTGDADEEGAYVAAWVWVPNKSAKHTKIKFGHCRICDHHGEDCTGVAV